MTASSRRTRRVLERPDAAEDTQAAGERRRAARALLSEPMLHGTGRQAGGSYGEDLRLVRRHRDELTRELAHGLGYRLIVEPGGARLVKAGLGRDGTRPLRRPAAQGQGRPFTPRAYALLALTLAALTRTKAQLLISELVTEIRSVAADAGVGVDLDAIADRRALHSALLVLVDLGVLAERDGDLAHWAEDAGAVSLLDVSRERLRLLLAVPLSAARDPEDLLAVAELPSAVGGARIAVRRLLAESPLLSTSALTEEQAEWWRRNRNREVDWFADRLGLDLELRAEGAVAIDASGELTDEPFPGTGSLRHYAVLLLGAVVNGVRAQAREAAVAERTWWPVPDDVGASARAEVLARHGQGFRKDLREDPDSLHVQACSLLVAMGLLRPVEDNPHCSWAVHAAAGRYAPRPRQGLSQAATLFDELDDGSDGGG
jgi:uncharacterized protein (TIGR02678 family)